MAEKISKATRAAMAAARAAGAEAARRWATSPEVRALARRFADCPTDDPRPAADRAEALFADGDWAARLLGPLIAALRANPFFEPPLPVARDPVRTGGRIFDCPAVTLTASILDAAALAAAPAPATVVVSGRMTVTCYLRAGGAQLRRWRVEPAGPAFSAATAKPCVEEATAPLADGAVCRLDGRVGAQLIAAPACDVVALVATMRAGAAPLMREYRIADGALLRVASGDEHASRTELLLTFLRAADARETGAAFAEATRDSAFHLRWAAMREWLLLDAPAAWPRLIEMAEDDRHPDVRAAARTTLARATARVEPHRAGVAAAAA